MSEVQEDNTSPVEVSDLSRIAEAIIFASSEPVRVRDLAQIVAEVTGDAAPSERELEDAIASLSERYEAANHGIRIRQWGGGYRIATSADLSPYLKAYFDPERTMRLTRSLMETLAILAYKQPVTKPEVDFVRGVDSDYAIRRLLEIGLVDVVGRSDSVGRPLLYGTTPRFLEQFGLNSLEDLPKLREIEELLGDPNFNQERAKLLALEGLDRSETPNQDTEQAPDSGVDPD